MKFTKAICVGSLAFLMALVLSNSAATTPTAPETKEEKEVATSGKYEVTNNTGAEVKELYFFDATSSDKGTNYTEGGLADGASVTVAVNVNEDKADGYTMKAEYITEE